MKTDHGTAIRAAGCLVMMLALVAAGCGRASKTVETEDIDLTGAAGTFQGFPGHQANASDPSEVVATVNGAPVTRGELNQEIEGILMRSGGQIPADRVAEIRGQLGPQVLESIIVKKLLDSEADASGIEVAEEEIDRIIAQLAGNLPEGADWNEQLRQAGIDEEALRAEIQSSMRIDALLQVQTDGIKEPTAQEISAYYRDHPHQFERPETISASHILVAVDDPSQRDARRAEAEALREQLLQGADFAALAAAHSACPSKEQGGHLGSFARGQMVPAFEEAAFALQEGELSDVVETDFGFHIITLDSRSEAGKIALPEAMESIKDGLLNQRRQEAINEYVESLKDQATITYPGQDQMTP